MWSELCASRQRRAALLGVIAEYCVCGAESEFSASARVEQVVSEREAFTQAFTFRAVNSHGLLGLRDPHSLFNS